MLLPSLLTMASLTVASLAMIVIDCSSPSIEILEGDPIRVCATIGSLGVDADTRLGEGLVVFALLALFAIWAPIVRPRRQRGEIELSSTLLRNLSRIADITTGSGALDPRMDAHALRLTRKLEALEVSLSADSVGAREVTEQWMGLLREANDLHNRDELAAGDFKRINTRLLLLFSGEDEAETVHRPGEGGHTGSPTV